MEIKKGQQDFKALFFCTQALDMSNKIYDYAQTILIENEKSVATDGKKLFLSNCFTIQKGYYTVTKKTKQLIILKKRTSCSFPNYQNILNNQPKNKLCSVNFGSHKAAHINKLIKLLPENIGIDTKFLDLLIGEYNVFYDTENTNTPLFFKNDTKTAVIMPLFIENL